MVLRPIIFRRLTWLLEVFRRRTWELSEYDVQRLPKDVSQAVLLSVFIIYEAYASDFNFQAYEEFSAWFEDVPDSKMMRFPLQRLVWLLEFKNRDAVTYLKIPVVSWKMSATKGERRTWFRYDETLSQRPIYWLEFMNKVAVTFLMLPAISCKIVSDKKLTTYLVLD